MLRYTHPSYWQQSVTGACRVDLLPSLAEVMVIGGGVLGVAASYWLARAGVAVTLIEREALAAGATGAMAG